MCNLKLVEASKEYEKQAMEYKNDFISHGEKLKRVMISCDKSNRAYAKVAVKNGGILSGEGFDEESESVTEIYWIDLL